MSFGNNSVSNDTLLKEYYSDEGIENALFQKNKFHAMLPKNEMITGRHFVHPIQTATGQGRSVDFATAQAMAGLSGETINDFFVALQENSAVANVASKLIAQTENDKGAFMKATTVIVDGQLINFGNDLAVSEYRSSDGSRGQLAAGLNTSGSVITFVIPKDVLNFEVGMQLDVADSKTDAHRAYGSGDHGLYISKVDYTACTITTGILPTPGSTPVAMDDSTDGCPDIEAGDYLFVTGDQGKKLNGFQDWIVYGGPQDGDSFNGVDRTSNPTRLAGLWMDGTAGGSLTSVLEDAIGNVGEVGGELSHIFMPFKQFTKLSKELTGRSVLVDVKVNAEVGYEGIKVTGSTGDVICLPDRACPANTLCGVQLDAWELMSVGKAVHIWDDDGKVWLRSSTQAGMEVRFYSFANVLCKDPHSNINIRVTP